ncbi:MULTISPECIES: DUF805 domain-containing protein [Chromobacterium]|uniref:DUF805 domain-containing protein n=1 Tax=Chromobacterium TaxID=535 RepID=UPI0018C89843|nr:MULTISPECIES: DUF805 domain-containing protein [Chromobacterium]WON85003.1 DUF805 domain-containing protein [Chromobacterium haemolyticum]
MTNKVVVSQNQGRDLSSFGWFVFALKNIANFNGRARRKEFWYYMLFSGVATMLISFVSQAIALSVLGSQEIGGVVTLFICLPLNFAAFSVFIRRLHDVGRSGWWVWVPIAPLVFAFFDSEAGANQYGPSPKYDLVN